MDNKNNKSTGAKVLRTLLTVLLSLLVTAIIFVTLKVMV